MPTHALVADLAHHRLETPFQFGPALRRVEAAAARLAHPDEVGERAGAVQHLAHRLRPAVAQEVVRVLAFGQEREAQRAAGAQERQRQFRRSVGGLQARAVAVEAEDGLRDRAPEKVELALGQGRAERSDGVLETALVERDHVM